MNKAITASLSLAILLFISGCASHKYTVLEPSTKALTDYRILEIRDFTSNLADEESKKLAQQFAGQLYENVMRDRTEHPSEVIFERVVRETNETDDVLVLDGTVISYEKGSRAKRYWIGFGAGKAYCTIRSVFTDKKTGEQVVKLDFDGELSGGLFGGSEDEAVQAVVKAYLEYFDDYFATHVAK